MRNWMVNSVPFTNREHRNTPACFLQRYMIFCKEDHLWLRACRWILHVCSKCYRLFFFNAISRKADHLWLKRVSLDISCVFQRYHYCGDAGVTTGGERPARELQGQLKDGGEAYPLDSVNVGFLSLSVVEEGGHKQRVLR